MLTVLSNRIDDVGLLMVIAWMFNFDSWSFVYYSEFLSGSLAMELISSLVVLAAMTGSAEIPFSAWLPAAVAASIPISVLPLPVAACSKARVYGRLLAAIAGSNPTGGMDVFLLGMLCVVR